MNAGELLGETVRVWDAQHCGVFCEGKVIAFHDGPVIWVRWTDEDGVEHTKAHVASLPIDVMRWVPRGEA